MNLYEVMTKLDAFDGETTIYFAKPWTPDSKAIVTMEPEDGSAPIEAKKRKLIYLLEVQVARDFVADWDDNLQAKHTLHEKCARLIRYASTDA